MNATDLNGTGTQLDLAAVKMVPGNLKPIGSLIQKATWRISKSDNISIGSAREKALDEVGRLMDPPVPGSELNRWYITTMNHLKKNKNGGDHGDEHDHESDHRGGRGDEMYLPQDALESVGTSNRVGVTNDMIVSLKGLKSGQMALVVFETMKKRQTAINIMTTVAERLGWRTKGSDKAYRTKPLACWMEGRPVYLLKIDRN